MEKMILLYLGVVGFFLVCLYNNVNYNNVSILLKIDLISCITRERLGSKKISKELYILKKIKKNRG
jgi:hypothetical protein